MSVYRRDFDKTKCMSFLIKNEKLLGKYNKIWRRVSNITKKEFDSNPVYDENYIKTKIQLYNGKINTHFNNNKIPKEGFEYICLSVILLDSVYKKDKNYYPQVFLECKYVTKEKKRSIKKFITDNIEISSDDSDKVLISFFRIWDEKCTRSLLYVLILCTKISSLDNFKILKKNIRNSTWKQKNCKS